VCREDWSADVPSIAGELPISPAAAVPLFLVSLVVTLASARLFARRLDRLGLKFGFPEALIGLLTALAADGPEISSALFALIRGDHNVSVGVLVGSNAFNLAAMIGISGLLTGCVLLPRETLLLEGLFGALIMLIAAGVLLQWLDPVLAATIATCVLVPYLLLVIGGSELLARGRGGGPVAGDALARVLAQRVDRRSPPALPSDPTHHLLGLMVLDIALIVAGSAGMVETALSLGDQWHVSHAELAVLVLAPLTSVPNALTGVRLGLAGRAAALVGETFNSNTINLGAGVIAPAVFTTLVALDATAKLQLVWLIAMTLWCMLLLGRPRGMRRGGAATLVVLYLGFVATQIRAV
jgi:cation:H+ antiporter